MYGNIAATFKNNLRKIVYKNQLLLKIWNKYYKVKSKIPFMHWLVINQIYFNYLIKVKKYKVLAFEREIVNGIYKIYLEEKTNTVVKIIRRDNLISYQFYLGLKKRKNFKRFVDTLEGASKVEFLGTNTTKALKVHKNGSYSSSFIEGVNLQILISKLSSYGELTIEKDEIIGLIKAIDNLYYQLEKYHNKHGHIPGDWMLHNLVYAKGLRKVINVDLEGFYTYTGYQIENNIERIKSDLVKLKSLL